MLVKGVSVKRTFNLITIFILGLFSCVLVNAEDLLGVVEQAKKNDPTYLASRHLLDSKSEAYAQARSYLLPSLSYQYEKRKTDQSIVDADNTVFATGDSKFDTTSKGLVLNQPLFDWAIWSRFKQSEEAVSSAKADAILAEQELLLRASESYFLVLEGQDQLNTVEDEKAALETHFKVAQRKKLAGLGRSVDVEAAEARYLESVAKKVELESRLQDSRYALLELTGTLPQNLKGLSEDISYTAPEPATPQHWVDIAKQHNPKIISAEHALGAAKQEIEAQRAGHYPNVDLTYTRGTEKTGGSLFGGGSEVDTNELVLNVKIPIFSGMNASSKVKQARADRYRVLEELHKVQRETEREIRDSLMRISGSIRQIEALNRSVSAQQRMLDIKNSGYKRGVYSMLEVLDAQKDLASVQQAYTKARYDYVLNSLRLKFASGSLGDDDIFRINRWLTVSQE